MWYHTANRLVGEDETINPATLWLLALQQDAANKWARVEYLWSSLDV